MGATGSYSETGAVVKAEGGRLAVLLVFPNSYFVGMSNLGFHAMYSAFNSLEFVRCERAFLPEDAVRVPGPGLARPVSVESGLIPSRFHIIAFSLPFENDYPNLVRFLVASGLGASAEERSAADPLVIAGGWAVTANPEPISRFVDAVVIGEGEEVAADVAAAVFDARKKRLSKEELLEALDEIDGVYVPSLFRVEYSSVGTVAGVSHRGSKARVKRRLAGRERLVFARTCVFSDETEFGQMALIEAVRGCPRSCRFCLASYCRRPARFVAVGALVQTAGEMLRHRKTIGLVGSAVGDHPDLEETLERLLEAGCTVSLPSLRADRISEQLLMLIRKAGQRTITIAPEAGDERLRRALGKPIADDELIQVAVMAASTGFSVLKLYFIVGLPGEKEEDVDKIAELVKRMRHELRRRFGDRGGLGISLSISSLVPKAKTPFQWVGMMRPSEISRRIKQVKRQLRGQRGVYVHSDLPKWAYVQAVLSRGDRRCAKFVEALARTGMNWQATCQEVDLSPDFYAIRKRKRDEVFPWAHIDSGVSDEELWSDLNKYRSELGMVDTQVNGAG